MHGRGLVGRAARPCQADGRRRIEAGAGDGQQLVGAVAEVIGSHGGEHDRRNDGGEGKIAGRGQDALAVNQDVPETGRCLGDEDLLAR